MKKIYIFDMDGTLTPSRRKMTSDFENFFSEWANKNTFFLVSGSDLEKIREQVPEYILNLSEYIKSNLIFAHIRAIKPFSIKSIVNYQNCPPFNYFNFVWMHNGDIKHNIELEKYVYNNCLPKWKLFFKDGCRLKKGKH